MRLLYDRPNLSKNLSLQSLLLRCKSFMELDQSPLSDTVLSLIVLRNINVYHGFHRSSCTTSHSKCIETIFFLSIHKNDDRSQNVYEKILLESLIFWPFSSPPLSNTTFMVKLETLVDAVATNSEHRCFSAKLTLPIWYRV